MEQKLWLNGFDAECTQDKVKKIKISKIIFSNVF